MHERLKGKIGFPPSSPDCSIATWFLLLTRDKSSLLAFSECLNLRICHAVYCGFVFLHRVSVKYWYIFNYSFNLIRRSANFIWANKQFTLPSCVFRSFIWKPDLHCKRCFLLTRWGFARWDDTEHTWVTPWLLAWKVFGPALGGFFPSISLYSTFAYIIALHWCYSDTASVPTKSSSAVNKRCPSSCSTVKKSELLSRVAVCEENRSEREVESLSSFLLINSCLVWASFWL